MGSLNFLFFGDRLGLADAMRAVGCLIFHGGVPPRIHVDHVRGTYEVKAHAAGLQREEERVDLAALKPLDELLPRVFFCDGHYSQGLFAHGTKGDIFITRLNLVDARTLEVDILDFGTTAKSDPVPVNEARLKIRLR